MNKQIGAAKMREIADLINDELGGNIGFALLTFRFHEPGMANYISNAKREDMIKALEETLERWKGNEDFPTPEEN